MGWGPSSWYRVFATTAPMAQESSSGIEGSVHGLILMNAFHTSEDVNNSDVPQFVLPAGPNPSRSTSSATVRQSRVTVTGIVPEFAGGALSGELDVDFYGGQQPSTGGRTFPLLRIRRALAELTWTQFAAAGGTGVAADRRGESVHHGGHRLPRLRGLGQSLALDPADQAERGSPSHGWNPVRCGGRGPRADVGRATDGLPHPAGCGGAELVVPISRAGCGAAGDPARTRAR